MRAHPVACLVKSKSRYPSQASARIPSGSPELEVLRIAGQCIFWTPSVHIKYTCFKPFEK
uniref:Uncharacterized protein n=1 Tax=Anguilla anguilla TaxID=7936 RepID=A0A0E9W9N7_ANGAN